MRSILLEGITSREEARALLRNILPGRESPWLLKNTTGDPVAYFDLSETDVDIEGPAVVAEISGRHYDEDENVLEVLRKLQAVVGGRITDAPQPRTRAARWLAFARRGCSPGTFGCNEVKGSVESNTTGKIQYAFRRPRFPVIYAVRNELRSASSPAAFQRQAERLELQGAAVLDLLDATGEGWAFHADLMIVSPLTLKKRWKKIEVIRLFNESDNARRIGVAYPETYIPRRSLVRIIAEVAALTTYAKPNQPLTGNVRQTKRHEDSILQ